MKIIYGFLVSKVKFSVLSFTNVFSYYSSKANNLVMFEQLIVIMIMLIVILKVIQYRATVHTKHTSLAFSWMLDALDVQFR